MATEIINHQHNAGKLLEDAVNSVTAELCYIKELAEIIYEQAGQANNGERLEALSLSLRRYSQSVLSQLTKHVDEAYATAEAKAA